MHSPIGKKSDVFGLKQRPLHFLAAEGPAAGEGAVTIDDTMRRQAVAFRRGEEGPAHFSRSVRRAESAGDRAVGGDTAVGDLGYEGVDTVSEGWLPRFRHLPGAGLLRPALRDRRDDSRARAG